jgi:hypothetical protein
MSQLQTRAHHHVFRLQKILELGALSNPPADSITPIRVSIHRTLPLPPRQTLFSLLKQLSYPLAKDGHHFEAMSRIAR